MTDLSTPEPIDGPPWPEWTGNDARRCVGHKKTGEQCRRHARRGTTVCDFHGAKAPQVKAKARQRLEEAADRMARELLKMATDENTSDATKLAAIRDALDRGGVGAKTSVEVEVGLKPFEEVMGDIVGVATISRAESRARRGLTDDTRALAGEPLEVVDAELVPEDASESRPGSTGATRTPTDRGDGAAPRFAEPSGPPSRELVTLEEATAEAAQANRQARVVQVRRRR